MAGGVVRHGMQIKHGVVLGPLEYDMGVSAHHALGPKGEDHLSALWAGGGGVDKPAEGLDQPGQHLAGVVPGDAADHEPFRVAPHAGPQLRAFFIRQRREHFRIDPMRNDLHREHRIMGTHRVGPELAEGHRLVEGGEGSHPFLVDRNRINREVADELVGPGTVCHVANHPLVSKRQHQVRLDGRDHGVVALLTVAVRGHAWLARLGRRDHPERDHLVGWEMKPSELHHVEQAALNQAGADLAGHAAKAGVQVGRVAYNQYLWFRHL